MAPYIVGSPDSFAFSPTSIEGGISAIDGELTFASGGDPPARATQPQQELDEVNTGESPSDDEDEDDSDIFVNPTPEYPKLDHAARLSGYVHELTEVALSRFFTRSALQIQFPRRRNTEGDYQYPQPGTARGAAHAKRRKSNADDTSRIAAPSFVCPFYVLKPAEYRGCLKHDLRRILDVKRHLWAAHHIRSGQCEPSPATDSSEPVVSEDQLHRIAEPASPDTEDEAQWLSIWSIVFKDVAQPSPSHIVCDTEDLVQKLDVLRGFWKAQGIRIIGGFLESKGIPSDDPRREQRNLEALHGIVLNRMVDKVLAGLS